MLIFDLKRFEIVYLNYEVVYCLLDNCIFYWFDWSWLFLGWLGVYWLWSLLIVYVILFDWVSWYVGYAGNLLLVMRFECGFVVLNCLLWYLNYEMYGGLN